MIKKLFTVTMMLFYLSAAFGVVLGQASCCEEPDIAESMACHEVCLINEDQSHTNPGPNPYTHNEPKESCCPDCEFLFFSVQKDHLSELTHTDFPSSVNSQKLQAAIIVLPWVVDYFSLIPFLEELEVHSESPLLTAANPVQIFIRDCTYRI